MRILKKSIALAMTFIMGLSLGACSNSSKKTETTEITENAPTEATATEIKDYQEDTTEIVTEASTEATTALDTPLDNYSSYFMPEENGETIFVYASNDNIAKKVEYFKSTYPQFASMVEVRVFDGTDDEYLDFIVQALQGNEEVPSVVMCEDDILRDMISSNVYKDLHTIGFTEDMYSNTYEYTRNFATSDGELKALTWQSNPGTFVYRTDIAEEVLGTSDPVEIQEYVKNWDAFISTAKLMKERGYYMLSGCDDIVLPFAAQSETPLVENGKISIDANVEALITVADYLHNEEYTMNSAIGDDLWKANMDGVVFGYFAGMETIEEYFYDKECPYYGMRRMCAGPANYQCDVPYIGITHKCPNQKLAALMVYSLCCDSSVMYQICEDEDLFVNNKEVIKEVMAEGKGANEALGGQSTYEIWDIASDSVGLNCPTEYDDILLRLLYEQVQLLYDGEMPDVEAVKDEIEQKMVEECKELKAE